MKVSRKSLGERTASGAKPGRGARVEAGVELNDGKRTQAPEAGGATPRDVVQRVTGASPRIPAAVATREGATVRQATLQATPRSLPAAAPDTIHVRGNGGAGRMILKKIGASADMLLYVTHIKGKPSFLFVMAQLSDAGMLRVPYGLLDGRRGWIAADRDGVVKDSRFLNEPDKQQAHDVMIPSALTAAKALNDAGIGLAIVTNQGGYEVGKMTFEDTLAINVRVIQQIANAGGHVDAVFICPFNSALKNPPEGTVDARKPGSGMTMLAKRIADHHGLPTLAMVGDQRTDGAAGQGAGLPFYAVTDDNGRWTAELESAKKNNEQLPVLDTSPGRYAEVSNFAAAVTAILAKTT